MAVKLPAEEQVDSFNMTPMIDCVFQLLIFFMLVNDMSSKQVERLNLPAADQAFKEENVDVDEIIINIMPPGNLPDGTIGSVTRVNGRETDSTWLESFFRSRRAIERYWEVPGGRTVKYPILIRADATTYWMEVQRIMMMATMYGGVHKVALGARMTPGQGG